MARYKILILVFLVSTPSTTALARQDQAKQQWVPLMHSTLMAKSSEREPNYTSSSSRRSRGRVHTQSSKILGAEIGALGRKTSNADDLLGFRLLYGVRGFMVFSLAPSLFLKPTLGVFMNSQGQGSTSVTQFMFEGGANVQYALFQSGKEAFLIGISNKFSASYSSISAPGDAGGTPLLFKYRVGPSIGYTVPLSGDTALVTDLDVTVSIEEPMQIYSGVSVGLGFSL